MNHAATSSDSFNIAAIRADFPILDQQINGCPLVYLDNGATTQKPIQVIEAIEHFYKVDYSNVHRGIHTLSQRATERFESARQTVKHFIGAGSDKEIIFTRGTTEAINLVAHSWGGKNLQPGDEILVSEMEHHSNIVPWQILAQN
jgi:cysteine desulfurase/selenocysteine lyase